MKGGITSPVQGSHLISSRRAREEVAIAVATLRRGWIHGKMLHIVSLSDTDTERGGRFAGSQHRLPDTRDGPTVDEQPVNYSFGRR